MAVFIVRLGTPRHPDGVLRLGAVRRPPRDVPGSEYAARDWYDIGYPNPAPSLPTRELAQRTLLEEHGALIARR